MTVTKLDETKESFTPAVLAKADTKKRMKTQTPPRPRKIENNIPMNKHCFAKAGASHVPRILWILLTLALGHNVARSATIYYVGTVTNTTEVVNWLTPTTVKTYDIYGDNKYGNYCAVDWAGVGTYTSTSISFINGGGQYRQPEYPLVNDLADASQGNVGPNALVNDAPTNANAGIILGNSQFQVNQDMTGNVLRVGVMTDLLGPAERPESGNQGIRLVQYVGGYAQSVVVPISYTGAQPRMSFFDIVGAQVGDQYSAETLLDVGDNISGKPGIVGPMSWDTNLVSAVSDLPYIFTNSSADICRVGSGYILGVFAGGAPAPSYQWFQGTSPVANATNATVFLPNLTLADSANYKVVVTTPSGSVTSSPISLTVVSSNLPSQITDYRAAVMADPSLISYYTFDDGVLDSVGTNNGVFAGTPVVGCSLGQGVGQGIDKALNVSGDGCVTLGTVGALEFINGIGTVELWLRADWTNTPGGSPTIVANRDDTIGTGYDINMGGGKDYIGFWNNAAYNTIPIPNAGTNWHQMAVIFTNSTWTIVWDGQVAGTGTEAIGTLGPLVPTLIGGQSLTNDPGANEYWMGAFDEVAFYSNALSPSEILSHYNAFIADLPPAIITQPQGESLLVGMPFTFSITASGNLISYQWYENGVSALSATNNTLAFSAVALSNAGTYYCVVSNLIGAVTSSPVVLQVSTVIGADVSNYEAVVQAEPSLISFYTFNNLTANDSVGANNGTLQGQAQFAPGFGGGPDQALHLLGDGWGNLGSVADFGFPNQGTVELWWRADWTAAPGYNPCLFSSRDDDLGVVNYSFHMDGPTKSLIGMWNGIAYDTTPIAAPGTNWHYTAITFNSGTWTLFIDGQNIASVNQLNNGDTAPCQIGSSGPYGQEYWIGALDEVAYYSAALTPEQVQAHYSAFLTTVPPSISAPPQGGEFLAGNTLILSPGVIGDNLSYQWYKGSTLITGANGATLAVPNATTSDSGDYSVVITNLYGSVTSAPISVNVVVPTPAQYDSTVLQEAGLVSFYTFDQSNANDVIGTNNGTFITSSNFTAGLGGGTNTAILMDGENGAVTFGNVPAFSIPSGSGTYELWLRADWDTNNMSYNPAIVANENTAINFEIRMAAGKSSILFNADIYSIPYASTNWHYLAVVVENPYCAVYWDGQLINSQYEGIQSQGSEPTQLGSTSPTGASVWLGAMDDVAFYGTALSALDVANDYQAMFGAGPVTLSITRSGGNVTVSWPAGGAAAWTLESAAQLSSTNWTAVSSNTPAVFPISNQQQYFRLRQQ